jgi:cyanophycinase
VQCGSLVIAGGGRLPPEVLQRFIELAGGPDAPLVVLPTALPGDAGADSAEARMLEGAGARRVTVLPERRRADVESEQFLGVISEARGVWFGGGRQWRFVDAYEGTRAAAAFRELLDRGGVIGGSSAGATIQGECLVRGSPLGNEQMLAPGYERGFAFLPGSAIDQHFAQRQRFADMTKLVAIYPQILGVGIDEGTALIVRGRVAEVTGAHQVHFFDRARLDPARSTDFESVPAGGQYDLVARRRVDGR